VCREWGFEKLVFQKVLKRGVRYDRKYAIQARHAGATGIHMSTNMRRGKRATPKSNEIRYYHYHGTIDRRDHVCYHYHGTIKRRDGVCSSYVDPRNQTALLSHGVRLDETMAKMAKDVKSYEVQTIGTSVFSEWEKPTPRANE
jgi:hypothetical protein